MAALTLTDYLDLCKRVLGVNPDDSSNPIYTDAWLTRYINDAQCEIVRRAGQDFFKSHATANAPTGLQTVPTDFLANLEISYAGSGGTVTTLLPTTIEHLDKMSPSWSDTTGTPTSFYMSVDTATGDMQYGLYPAPSAVETNALSIRYNPIPTEMSKTTDECLVLAPFPDFQTTLIPYFVAARVKMFENGTEDDQVQKFTGLFENELLRFRAALKYLRVAPRTWRG